MPQSDWLAQVDRLPHGWALVAVSKNKRPYNPDHPQGREWQKNPLPRERFKALNGKFGAVGLLLGPVSGGIVAIDHDGHSATTKIEELSGLLISEALPMTVGFTSGRPGRYQVVYRVPEQYWGAICTRKILTGTKDPIGGKDELVEFRWEGAQSVILGDHPDTDGYSWVSGRAPWEIAVAECPQWVIEQMLDDTPPHVNAPRTEWRIERPLEQPIPLVHLLTKEHAILVEDGAVEGQRNDEGAALARDLIGCENWARGAGVHFEGSAQELFWQFADRSGLPGRESKTIWRSAERDNPGPARSDDGLKVAVKWWEKQYKAKVVGTVAKQSRTVEQSKGREENRNADPAAHLQASDIVAEIRAIEEKCGFLTEDYDLEISKLSFKLKRSVPMLQTIYTKSLARDGETNDASFAEVCRNAPARVPWLIPGLLYRGSTIIFHADGGAGKTLLAYNLVKSLSFTKDFLGKPVIGDLKCGVIQVDEPSSVFIERMRELELDNCENRVKFNWSFGQLSTLPKWIEDRALDVVVIDSFFAAQKYADTSENESTHAAVLMRLRDIAQNTNTAIIIIHHSNKKGGIRGSSAIQGAVSEVWHLTAPIAELHSQYKLRADERIFECQKTRMVKPFKLALGLDEHTLTWKSLGDLKKIDNGTVNEPATWSEKIALFLEAASEPFTISDLLNTREMVGLSRDVAKVTLGRLDKSGMVTKLSESKGGKETSWLSTRFLDLYKKHCYGVTVEAQDVTQQGFDTVTSTVTSTVTRDRNSESVTDDSSVTDSFVTDDVTVGVTVPKPLQDNDPSLNRNTVTPKNEIFERIQKTEKSTYVPRPSSEYTGPPVGTIVRFSDQGVSPKEIKALQQRGVNYPWGLTGRISDVFATTGNRYAATVTTDDLGTYTVKDFLALEVLELPEDAHRVSSADQPWDDSVQPDLEW